MNSPFFGTGISAPFDVVCFLSSTFWPFYLTEKTCMSEPTMNGCLTKIDRAMQHIDQINDEVGGGMVDVDPETIQARRVRYNYPSKPVDEMVFSISGDAPNIPPLLSVLVGEVVFQLRSALDHLVYQLIVAYTKKKPTFRSQFPIVGHGRKRQPDALAEYEAQKPGMIKGVSPTAEAIIDKVQPLQRGASYDKDPLWMIQELHNIDKHRILNLMVRGIASYRVEVRGPAEATSAFFQPRVLFEDGAELGRLTLPASHVGTKVEVHGKLTLDVAVEKVGRFRNISMIPLLFELHDYVDGIIDACMRLPEFPWKVCYPPRNPELA